MYPEKLFVIKNDTEAVIGNEYIVRCFSVSDKRLKTAYILNRRTEKELKIIPQFGSEEFAVSICMPFGKKKGILSSNLSVGNIEVCETELKCSLTFTFEPYILNGIKYNFIMAVEMKNGEHFMKKHIEFNTSDDSHVKVDYIDTERIALGTEIEQQWSRPDMEKAFIKKFQSALGQPVYLNAMFTGSEFPANDNNIQNGVARLRYYAGKTLESLKGSNEKYRAWNTVFGAARSVDFDVIRADFLEYIKTISQPLYVRTQYNSWYDHMLEITAENIEGSFFEIEKGLTQYGVKPVDSYVVDDGWTDYDKDFWCFNKKFPNELYDSSALAKKFSSDFGLWLGPRGGYNFNRKLGKHMQRAGKGGFNRQSQDICIADNNYVENVTALFLDFMKRFDINYWKIDGFMLRSCHSKRHGHPTGGFEDMYCFTDAWEKWIGIFTKMRNLRAQQGKTLWINQTCYAIPSPWFLQWTDSVWMQNSGDIGFTDKTKSGKAMKGKDFDRMLTYRDSLYFDFHKTRMYQFPTSNMYNHEPIYGNTAKIHMEDDEYRKYMYMIATRGTAFWELYYSYNLFNPDMWRINADVLSFVENNFDILRNSKLIGESPDTGSVYGYSAWNGDEGIISLRNPMDYTQNFDVTLDRIIGVGENAQALTRVNILPYAEKPCAKKYSYGDKLSAELGAHEIIIYKFTNKKQTPPKLIRAKFIDDSHIEMNFDKHIVIDENSFVIDAKPLKAKLSAGYNSVIIEAESENAVITYSVSDIFENTVSAQKQVSYYKDGIITESSENPQQIENDFSINFTVSDSPKDTMLLTQGSEFAVSVVNGTVHFDCKGVKAKSKTDISGKEKVSVCAVRERNGMIKLYLDGVLECSGYDSAVINPVIEKAEMKIGTHLDNFKIIDKALSFDEIH